MHESKAAQSLKCITVCILLRGFFFLKGLVLTAELSTFTLLFGNIANIFQVLTSQGVTHMYFDEDACK